MSISSDKSALSSGSKNSSDKQISVIAKDKSQDGQPTSTGYSYQMGGFFLVAYVAGVGFLALPAAIANTGWLGVPMMIIFGIMVGFTGSCLGSCWVMLEERWPDEYCKPARQPYMEMAYRAYGKYGRGIALVSVMVSEFGETTVFIILVSEMLFELTQALSTCYYVLIVGAFIIPCTWFGTPKDFWQGPALTGFLTTVACVIVFVQTLIDSANMDMVQYPNPSVRSFALGYGAILFAYGGSAVLPTIQNDMQDRSQFWKSIVIGFTCILVLYLPVSIAGYAVYGFSVESNIMFAVSQTIPVKCAIGLQIVNVLGVYVIGFNTFSQATEDILNIPSHFNWKRIVCRTSIVLIELVICLAIPDFSLIMNLVGGSTMTLCSFILPSIMYLKLARSGPENSQRFVPLWMKAALIQIVIVGTIGGILSTVSAFYAIISTPFSASCFANFEQTIPS